MSEKKNDYLKREKTKARRNEEKNKKKSDKVNEKSVSYLSGA